jgi:hypothetical protein
LLGQFFQHFRLGVRAQHQSNFFVPRYVNLIQFPRPRVNQLFQSAPLLLPARDRHIRAFQRIEHAK